jgi:thiamine pyrophosphate-dependent acetolactate synthase large subunit-like protein
LVNNFVLGGYIRENPVATKKFHLTSQSGEYSKIAAALGGYSEKVVHPDEIIPALKRAEKASASGQTALLEIITCEDNARSLK